MVKDQKKVWFLLSCEISAGWCRNFVFLSAYRLDCLAIGGGVYRLTNAYLNIRLFQNIRIFFWSVHKYTIFRVLKDNVLKSPRFQGREGGFCPR